MAQGLKVDARIERVHEMRSFMRILAGAEFATAAARGLNEHALETKRQSVTRITAFTGLSAGRVGGGMRVVKAKPGPFMTAMVESRDKATTLGDVGNPSWIRSMTGAQATAWNKRQTFPHTFVAKGEVYARQGKARLPLKKLYGPVIPNELAKPSRPNVPSAEAFTTMDLEKRVIRHVMLALGT